MNISTSQVLLRLVRVGGLLFSCQAVVHAQAVSIERVKITLTAEQKREQRPGRLYRVDPKTADRQWAADVYVDGRLSRSTRCTSQDTFEAETDRAVAFPDDPVRVRCNRQLTFSFTRPSFAIAPSAKRSFLELPAGEIDVVGLSQLRVAAQSAGNDVLEKATADSLVSSAAMWLGDFKLEKYVERDPSHSFQLALNQHGITALKAKQRMLKLEPTGQIDTETQKAITGKFFGKFSKSYGTTYCVVASADMQCSVDKPTSRGSATTQVRVRHSF